MIKKILCLSLSLLAFNAFATEDCKSTVEHIQINDDGRILIFLSGQNWHLLSDSTSDLSSKEKLSMALAAQASSREIMLRYPVGYDCNAWETNTPPTIVRTYK